MPPGGARAFSRAFGLPYIGSSPKAAAGAYAVLSRFHRLAPERPPAPMAAVPPPRERVLRHASLRHSERLRLVELPPVRVPDLRCVRVRNDRGAATRGLRG